MTRTTWRLAALLSIVLVQCSAQSNWQTGSNNLGSNYPQNNQYGAGGYPTTDRYNRGNQYGSSQYGSQQQYGGAGQQPYGGVGGIGGGSANFQPVYEWFKLDYNWLDEASKLQALGNRRFIPENNAIAGIKVYRDRIFVTIPRWKDGIPVTIASVPSMTSQPNASPRLEPFPNWQMQEIGNCTAFQFVQSMEIDTEGRMWIIDSGRTNILDGNSPPTRCSPKLVIIDLNSVQYPPSFGAPGFPGQPGYPNQQYPGQNPPYPNQPGSYPNQPYPNQPGGYPNQQYPNNPNQQYPNNPNQQYPNNPNSQYPNNPNSQYPNNPNSQYPNNPNSQYPNNPNSQYPNSQYPNTGSQYPNNPNSQYPNNPNQQYPNSQYPNSNNQYGRSNQFGSTGQYNQNYNQGGQYNQFNNTPRYDQFGNPVPGGFQNQGFGNLGFYGNFRIIKSYTFPSNVATQFGAYLNDIVLDNSNGWYAYITDQGDDPGIIVYSFREDRAWKVKDARSMRADPDVGFLSINNIDVELRGKNIDGIALSPEGVGAYERTLYFSPLGSYNLYSLSTSVLKNPNLPSDVSSSVVDLGRKQSVSDGMIMDNRGNLYFGLLGRNAIGVWNTNRGRFSDGQRIFAQDMRTLQWPDTFAIDETGYLYVVTNRLQNYITGRVNTDEPNYRILKTQIGGRSYLAQADPSGSVGRSPYGGGSNYDSGYNSYDNYGYWNTGAVSQATTGVVLIASVLAYWFAR